MSFKKGTPGFGMVTGLLAAAAGLLLLTLGFWKTLLLLVLFLAGYFFGRVEHKTEAVRGLINSIVPQKKEEIIDLKKSLQKEQEAQMRHAAPDDKKPDSKNGIEE